MKNTGRRRAGSSRQVTGHQTAEGVAALLDWLAMLPGDIQRVAPLEKRLHK